MDFTIFQPVEAGFRQFISFDAIDERQYQIPGQLSLPTAKAGGFRTGKLRCIAHLHLDGHSNRSSERVDSGLYVSIVLSSTLDTLPLPYLESCSSLRSRQGATG